MAAVSMADVKAVKAAPQAVKPAKSSQIIEGRALLEYRLEVLERASANRELAALTQMEHMRDFEAKATALEDAGVTEANGNIKDLYKAIGEMEFEAARLGGLAAGNFDKAMANRSSVESLSSKLAKTEQQRSARAYATNLKIKSEEAMRLASVACERAAIAFDKAGELELMAAASQNAAVWLEKLAVR